MPCDRIVRDIVLPVMEKLESYRTLRREGKLVEDEPEGLNEFLEKEIHNDPLLKGKKSADLTKEFQKLQAKSPELLRVWAATKLEKYLKQRTLVRDRLVQEQKVKRTKSGPPDRFREQLEKSEESWVIA